MSGATRHLVLAAILLLALLPAAQPQTPAPAQQIAWLGSEQVGQGFHIRVPVTLRNDRGVPVTNAAAAVTLDVAHLLADQGWTHTDTSGGPLLESFELDRASVRVVEVRDLQAPQPGTVHGLMLASDTRYEASDPRRYEVPSTHLAGRLTGPVDPPFDNRTNPVITVLWRAGGVTAAGAERHFLVYFDSLTNGPAHAPASYAGAPQGGGLPALFWSGPARQSYGIVSSAAGQPSFVTVVGLEPDTSVKVMVASPEGAFQAAPSAQGMPPNPFTVSKDQMVQAFVASGGTTVVRIDASKPVLAFGTGTGFVPSLDMGLAGKDFLFALTRPAAWEIDTVYFMAASDQPTVVQVTPLDANPGTGVLVEGAVSRFTLNGASAEGVPSNGHPFTTGPRRNAVDEGTCLADPGPGTSGYAYTPPANAPNQGNRAAPRLFRATVTSGGPVFLQVQPVAGAVPVPSRDGQPTGTAFMATAGWSDYAESLLDASPCDAFHRSGGWIAAAVTGTAQVLVSDPKTGAPVDPPSPPGVNPPNRRTIPAAPGAASGAHPAAVLDAPLRFEASGGPIFLYAGLPQAQTGLQPHRGQGPPNMEPVYAGSSIPPIHGPLWGADAARSYAAAGSTLLVAPYSGTVVAAATLHQASGGAQGNLTLNAGQTRLLADNSPSDRLASFRLNATKPIFALPMAADTAMFPGVPELLTPVLGPAEFRGHLLSISSPGGADPATSSTGPGIPVNYTLRVTNLGHGARGASLPDAIRLTLGAVPSGWDARLEGGGTSLTLPVLQTGERRDVQLTVTPAANLTAGALAKVTVTATSQSAAAVSDRLDTVTFVKSQFGVGLWFDLEGGPKTRKAFGDAAGFQQIPLVIRNLGTGGDTFALEAKWTSDNAWGVALRQGLMPIQEVALGAVGTATQKSTFLLNLTPPPGIANDVLRVTVVATSRTSPAVQATVTAIATLRAPSDLRLTAEQPIQEVAPGETAQLRVRLANHGNGSADVRLDLQADALDGWGPAALNHEDPTNGKLTPVSSISLAGRAEGAAAAPNVTLVVTLPTPASAKALDLAGLRISAAPAGSPASAEAILYVQTRTLHDLRAALPPMPLAVRLDRNNTTVAVLLENKGNLDEELRLQVADLPPAWTLETPSNLTLPRNGTRAFDILLDWPARPAAGVYNVTVDLVSADGNRTPLRLTARVPPAAAATSSGAGAVLASPGSVARATFPVNNTGNTPLRLSIAAVPGEPWALDANATAFTLVPGASTEVPVAWRVPRTQTTGTTSHRAELRLVPDDPNQPASTRMLEASVAVAQADLAVTSAAAFPGASGILVRATVANAGQREAEGIVVRLEVGGAPVDEVAIQRLPPGLSSNVTLLAPAGLAGGARVTADALDAVVEANEGNNGLAVAAEQEQAPGGPIGLLILALAVLATRRR